MAAAATATALALPVAPAQARRTRVERRHDPARHPAAAGRAATRRHHVRPGTRYYVGSLNDGRIVTGDVRREGTRVLLPGAPGRQIRGLAFDHRSGLVWAVGNVAAVAHVWAVDARSGAVGPGPRRARRRVPQRRRRRPPRRLGDRLLRRPAHPHPARCRRPAHQRGPDVRAARRCVARDGPGSFGANGIRELGRGQLLLDNSTAGGLWAVSKVTGIALRIRVTGGPDLVGGDGIEKSGTAIWVVRGEDAASVSQLRLRPTPSGWTARYVSRLTSPTLDVPSTATLVGRALYVVNARFGTPSPAPRRTG